MKQTTDREQELVSALQSAHPKIQKMCEEESDDAEAVAKLLEINDSIHRTIERYKLMKAGNVEAANKIERGTLGTTTGVGKNAANELSLIDFDPEPSAAPADSAANGSISLLDTGATQSAPSQPRTVEDDLLGLSIEDNGSGSETLGAISLGPNTTFTAPPGSIFGNPTSPPPSQSAFPQALSKPNYDAFASLGSALPTSKPATPAAPPAQQQRPQSQAPVDPFASLMSSSSRPATPSKQANTPQAKSQPLAAMSKPVAAAAGAQGDDEWTFESALPETSTVKVLSSDVEIEFEPRRPAGASYILITARFSNMTNSRIANLHFQVAVEKSYSLQLKPQTGREMSPKARNAIQQEVLLNGVPAGKGNVVKMRFKVSYELNGQAQEQQGTVPSLGIS